MSRVIYSFLLILVMSVTISAHCQIPCGIYDDENQFSDLYQHVETIRKSMSKIEDKQQNTNQQVRWVLNKEEHATLIQDVMNHYFLIQRIKPKSEDDSKKELKHYNQLLTSAHKVIVLSMKAKQSTDLDVATKLHDAILNFQTIYEDK